MAVQSGEGGRNRYQEVDDRLRLEHRVIVSGSAMLYSWGCSCGKQGAPTSQARAASGRDRHLQAERRRIHTEIFAAGSPHPQAPPG